MCAGRSNELHRDKIELGSIIGQGQFGDVHSGVFYGKGNEKIPVAVKTCKEVVDSATTDRFLEEACMLSPCIFEFFGEYK